MSGPEGGTRPGRCRTPGLTIPRPFGRVRGLRVELRAWEYDRLRSAMSDDLDIKHVRARREERRARVDRLSRRARGAPGSVRTTSGGAANYHLRRVNLEAGYLRQSWPLSSLGLAGAVVFCLLSVMAWMVPDLHWGVGLTSLCAGLLLFAAVGRGYHHHRAMRAIFLSEDDDSPESPNESSVVSEPENEGLPPQEEHLIEPVLEEVPEEVW